VLLLTGYLVGLWRRWPRTAVVLVAALLGVSAWQCVRLATKTRVAFADRRDACTYLGTLPPKLVFADFQLRATCDLQRPPRPPTPSGWTYREPHSFDHNIQRQELTAVTNAYAVTGGAREPYYGCLDCVLRAQDVPTDRWKLLKEFPDPIGVPVPWRFEPVRVWATVPPPDVNAPDAKPTPPDAPSPRAE